MIRISEVKGVLEAPEYVFLGSARGKNVFTVDALGTGKTPRVIQVLGNGQKARFLAGQGCFVMAYHGIRARKILRAKSYLADSQKSLSGRYR